MDQLMLTYLKVALWLADCSPSLSHILAQCAESCVSCCSLCLLASGCCALCLPLRPGLGWLGCWVALGLAVPVGGCGVGLGLLPLPCFPLYASSSMPIYIRECVQPCLGCRPCALCALGPLD